MSEKNIGSYGPSLFEIQRPSNKPPPPTPDVNSNEPWRLVEPDARSRRILSVRTKSSIHTFHLALTFGDPLPSGSWKPNFRGTRGLVRQRANHDDIELVSTSSACGNFFAAHMLRAYPDLRFYSSPTPRGPRSPGPDRTRVLVLGLQDSQSLTERGAISKL